LNRNYFGPEFGNSNIENDIINSDDNSEFFLTSSQIRLDLTLNLIRIYALATGLIELSFVQVDTCGTSNYSCWSTFCQNSTLPTFDKKYAVTLNLTKTGVNDFTTNRYDFYLKSLKGLIPYVKYIEKGRIKYLNAESQFYSDYKVYNSQFKRVMKISYVSPVRLAIQFITTNNFFDYKQSYQTNSISSGELTVKSYIDTLIALNNIVHIFKINFIASNNIEQLTIHNSGNTIDREVYFTLSGFSQRKNEKFFVNVIENSYKMQTDQ
ncbi:unnamed protein product, partial [Brachionus calyciflorus]